MALLFCASVLAPVATPRAPAARPWWLAAAGTDHPTTAVELATSWIPEVVTRLTVPVEPGH